MASKHGEVAACRLQPTAGLVEIEPSMAWNPSVVSGIGVVQNVDELYNDMHSYLASSGMSCRSFAKPQGDCSVWQCISAWLSSKVRLLTHYEQCGRLAPAQLTYRHWHIEVGTRTGASLMVGACAANGHRALGIKA